MLRLTLQLMFNGMDVHAIQSFRFLVCTMYFDKSGICLLHIFLLIKYCCCFGVLVGGGGGEMLFCVDIGNTYRTCGTRVGWYGIVAINL